MDIQRVYAHLNLTLMTFLQELHVMFPDHEGLQLQIANVEKEIALSECTSVLYDQIKINLNPVSAQIHAQDESIFTKADIGLLQFLQLYDLFPRFKDSEKKEVWNRLKVILSKAVIVAQIGPHANLVNDMMSTFMQKNPHLKSPQEMQSKFAIDMFTDPDLREKLFGMFQSKDGQLPNILSNIPNVLNGLGITQNPPVQEPETKDADNEANDNNETTDAKDTDATNTDSTTDAKDNDTKDTKDDTKTASSVVLCRQAQRKLERDLRKKKQKQNPLNNLSSFLSQGMKDLDLTECKKEMEELFSSDEKKKQFGDLMLSMQTKLPQMTQDLMASVQNPASLPQKMAEMAACMSPEDVARMESVFGPPPSDTKEQ